MPTTLTWTIESLEVLPAVDGLTNVVALARWRCQASDGAKYASLTGLATFGLPDPAAFVDFSQLTEPQVVAWCWASGLNRDVTEASVLAQLRSVTGPTPMPVPKPWA